MFAASTTPTPTSTSQWANRIYAFFHFLCFKPDQFNDVIAKTAFFYGATSETEFYEGDHEPPQRFNARPTVLLQAIVPSSGFTVTFRALIDSGGETSCIQSELAALLIENGATCEYIWPTLFNLPFSKPPKFNYRKICGLTLQSVENASVKMTTSFVVDECFPFIGEALPVDLVAEKMASLGLPMVQLKELFGEKMWSEEDP